MKSNVEYSTSSWVITLAVTAGLCAGLLLSRGEPAAFYPLLAIVVPMYLAALWFAPMSVTADDKEVCIHSSFKVRSIPMADIVKAERYCPQPGTLRTCASGGFMGYWGTFRDGVAGHYTGFWGRDDDCFMLTLADGRKYLLGCKDPDAMLAFINSRLGRH